MAEPEKTPRRPRHVLEDPSAQAVARVYAKAFVDAATASGVEEALEEFHSFLDDVLAQNPRFETLLLSAMISRNDKVALIDRVVGPHGSPLFANFLRVLANHDRLELLPLILQESQAEHEERTGRKHVRVTSASPLSAEVIETIRARLASAVPFEPVIDTETRPELLGGLVIRIGDMVYDSSLSTRLKQLRGRLRERCLHEIQIGRDRFSHPEGD
jgi:F-type H+-transporting ATPase subunit delta